MKRWLQTWLLATCIAAQAEDAKDKDINHYLVDISAGAVSAIGLIDAQGSPITTIETSQDLVMALTPFASRDGRKNAFGLAITPAKTTLLPMPGRIYVSSWYMRLLGNLTLSYAQNEADHAGQAYRKSAFSIDTVHFFRLEDDPVYQASKAFKRCADLPSDLAAREKQLNDQRASGQLSDAAFLEALRKLTDERETALAQCIDADLAELAKARWNSARMSVSYGEGRMRPSGGGASYSLGKSFNLNAQHPIGSRGLAQISLRQARDALDTSTLGTIAVATKSSRLAAVRVTYGDQEGTDLRALAEASSARSSSAGVFGESFMYAVGIDKKLAKGTWLEFRLGRSRAVADGKEQTSALLTLNLAPTLFEFKK